MSTPYTGFNWSFPPRAESRIPYNPDSAVLKMWKGFSDSMAQFKINGSNDQMVVFPDRHIEHWSRHRLDPNTKKASPTGQPVKLDYIMPNALRDEVLSFTPKNNITIYNVELLHQKTTMIKNTLYFFDVLVWDGTHLLGEEYGSRYKILNQILGQRYLPLDLSTIDGRIFVAENLEPSQWDAAWIRAQSSPYCEGLVLKRFGAVSRLQYGHKEKNNSDFLCRIRKPTKNSRF